MRAAVTVEYPPSTPRLRWSEQDPAGWWAAAVAGIRRLLAETGVRPGDVAAIGLTGQMHGLVLLDAGDRVLRPAILWNDQRTGPQCAAITQAVGAARLLELTGNPVLPGFTAPKIVWVREHEPDVYRRAALTVAGRTEPGPAAAVYAAYYPRYRALHAALAPEFKALAAWDAPPA